MKENTFSIIEEVKYDHTQAPLLKEKKNRIRIIFQEMLLIAFLLLEELVVFIHHGFIEKKN